VCNLIDSSSYDRKTIPAAWGNLLFLHIDYCFNFSCVLDSMFFRNSGQSHQFIQQIVFILTLLQKFVDLNIVRD